MGGLIARYACGCLFDPSTSLIAGMRPEHFIAIASPHLGLTAGPGPAQAPFIQWAGAVPLLQPLLQWVGPAVSTTLFQGTGRQMLCLDAEEGWVPPGADHILLLDSSNNDNSNGNGASNGTSASAPAAGSARTCSQPRPPVLVQLVQDDADRCGCDPGTWAVESGVCIGISFRHLIQICSQLQVAELFYAQVRSMLGSCQYM